MVSLGLEKPWLELTAPAPVIFSSFFWRDATFSSMLMVMM
jgi:hypothetical protein